MKNKWIKLLTRDASVSFSVDLIVSNKDILLSKIGYGIQNFYYDSITRSVYYIESEIMGLGRVITDKVASDPDFIQRDIKECYARGASLLKRSERFKKEILRGYSKKRLFDELYNFREKYLQLLPYVTYPHSIERYIIGAIRKELVSVLSQANRQNDIDIIYPILTLPTRLDMKQQTDVYACAYEAKKNKAKVPTLAKKLHRQYGWLPLWSITAQPLKTEYYEKEILTLSKQDIDYQSEIITLKNSEKNLQRNLETTLNDIQASDVLRRYVSFLQEYIFLRTYRKNIISLVHYNHLPLLDEIGRQTGAGKAILYMSYQEMLDALQGKQINIKEIEKRREAFAVYEKDGCLEIITGKNKITRLLQEIDSGVNSTAPKPDFVRGRVASRGKATGRACVVMSIREINKVKRNMILITPMTTPDFTPILKKIAAIVTNEGGVTCHAAIVSREFEIPCIVGTGTATDIFKDGDLLEVDAEKGICKKIL